MLPRVTPSASLILSFVTLSLALPIGGCVYVEDDDLDYGRPSTSPDAGRLLPLDAPAACGTVYGGDFGAVLDPTVVRIGLLLPESGAAGPVGREMARAVGLALEEVADLGLPDGGRLVALACDTATDPNRAVELSRWLINDLRAPAVIGPGLSAAATALEADGAFTEPVLFISPSATSPALADLADAGRFWRTAPSDGRMGAAIGVRLRAGAERVGFIATDDVFGRGIVDEATAAWCGGPCPVDAVRRAFVEGDDPAPAVQQVLAQAPDAIVVALFGQLGLDALQALAGFGGTIYLTESLRDPGFIGQVPDPILARVAGVAPAEGRGPAADQFFERYIARWGEAPGQFGARAYDATWALAHAIGALPPGTPLDGDALGARLLRMTEGALIAAGPLDWAEGQAAFRDPARGTFDLVGASGPIDFDRRGEVTADIEGWVFDLVDRATPSTGVVLPAGDEP